MGGPKDLVERLSEAISDRYRIEQEIGAGGMATVYLAHDLKHDRQVAIKVMRPELATVMGAERFLREVQISASLNHAHILTLIDSGEADGILFYVMPFMEGESLRDKMEREGQLPVDEALEITREVADALGYAHRHGIVHRDIKPENVLLSEGHAIVTDFGIARAVSAAGGSITQTGGSVGSPLYMSPEQADGQKELDGRSDVYSLACMLYEMLAGEPPFTGQSMQALMAKHALEPPPDVRVLRATVPEPLGHAIRKGLAKSPVDRFRSASLFAEALDELDRGVNERLVFKGARGRKARTATFILAGLLLIGAATVFWKNKGETSPTLPLFSIAVLPPQAGSGPGAADDFTGGFHYELQTQLGKVEALDVIDRRAVSNPTLQGLGAREIGMRLNAGSIVDFAVQAAGGKLRVYVALVDANSGKQIWSEGFERTLDDAFAVQSEIVQQIVERVGAEVTMAEAEALRALPTEDPEAYRLYVQAEAYRNRAGRFEEDLRSAQQLLERAVSLDPDYALAYARLALVHSDLYTFAKDLSDVRLRSIWLAAQNALRIDPDLPEAHQALGMAHYRAGAYGDALREFEIAGRSLKNDAEVWFNIGAVQRRLGHYEETLAAFERVARLRPEDAEAYLDLGASTNWLLHRYEESVRLFSEAAVLAPDLTAATVDRGWLFVFWQGVTDSIWAILDGIPTDQELGYHLGTAGLEKARLLLLERRPEELLDLLATTHQAVLTSQSDFLPVSLFAGWAHQLLEDEEGAERAFGAAMNVADSALADSPGDARVHIARGFALAGLGRTVEALDEAAWIEGTPAFQHDEFLGYLLRENRARVLAQAGAEEAALDALESLVAGPSFYITFQTIRMDPRWDPIRDHPRFRALLERS